MPRPSAAPATPDRAALRGTRAGAHRARQRSLALLVLVTVAACQAADAESGASTGRSLDPTLAQAGPVTAFVGVSVVPMDEPRVLRDQTVLVAGGRIAIVGPSASVEVPAGAAIVEGAGRWLVPGLGEMHAHVVGEETQAARTLFLYLSQGITTARGMLGQPEHLALRERLANGEILGPRLYTSGPSLNGNSIPSADSARRAVLHQVELGYDFMKIHPGLTREQYDAIVETGTEAGLDWAGHVPADVGLARALEARQASIDHLDQYMEAILRDGATFDESVFFGLNLTDLVDESKIADVARATAAAGVWNVPTQSLIENLASPTSPDELAAGPGMRYMPPRTVAAWVQSKRQFLRDPGYDEAGFAEAIAIRRRLIKALHDAGAGILLGSDAPQVFQVPGFSIQHELEIMVDAGLTPYEALRAGTVNVAVFFGTEDESGTIAEGNLADLVLVEGDPLADIRNMARRAGVMIGGRWVPASEIETRLAEIAADYAG